MNRFEKLKAWAGTDGLLHALACYAMMLTSFPIVGIWWTLAITVIAAVTKEAYDLYVQDDYTDDMVRHDLLCDIAGIILALVVFAIWYMMK